MPGCGRQLSGTFLSAGKVVFAASQRDDVQQGIYISSLPVSQSWGWNGEVDFDPASLFVTSANWKTAVAVLGKGADGTPRRFLLDKSDATRCFLPSDPSDPPLGKDALQFCEEEFAKARMNPLKRGFWWGASTVLIPTIQFKVLSQFEFLKQGGVLIANPNLQTLLKSVSVTWDLRRCVPSTADRLTIAALLAQPAKLGFDDPDPTKPPPLPSKICVFISGASTSYLGVGSLSTFESCRAIANSVPSSKYALACATDRNMYIGKAVDKGEEAKTPETKCNW